MRPNFPKPALPPASLTPAATRSPGQHEEIIDRVQNGFRETLDALDRIIKQRSDTNVIVHLDTRVQREILAIVKDIQIDVKELKDIVTSGSGISEAAEEALAAKLQSAIVPLKEAIDANQPSQPTGAPKKKKSTK